MELGNQMNFGVTLKTAEKVFGPALPGPGNSESTLSAVRFAGSKGKKFAGILGIHDNAIFYIHFPTAVDWNLLETKKGIPDHVNDLRESGPQGAQGREMDVTKFLEQYESIKAKLRAKREASDKKALTLRQKTELAVLRQRLVPFVGDQRATFTIGVESLSLPVKITTDKKGKLKIVANL